MEHRQSVGQSSDRAFVDHGDVSNELGNISKNFPGYNHSLLPSKLAIGEPLYSSLQHTISPRTYLPMRCRNCCFQQLHLSRYSDSPFPGRTGAVAKHFQKAATTDAEEPEIENLAGTDHVWLEFNYPFLHTGKPGTQDGVLRSLTPRVIKLPLTSATWPTHDISIERKHQKTRP
ncbi:uncharacterized protein P884DRAFT_303987 [Thermothelomyces heterothallicus CBS 202.75]|uniref:uncharacterized protein n=1 Tax=Thermothelomyces heterothallicus CBS 202.75 TaxID=1149848 RepID=UPI003743FACC